MKKKTLTSLVVVAILFISCTKTSPGVNNPPGGGGGGGNGGGTGGGGSSLTVTTISPANPYPDDEFTINGTGFNATASLDTVEFGHLINGNFAAWHDGLPDQYASLCNVVSASTTQLKVQAVNPFTLDYNSFNFNVNSIAVAQVRTGGKKVLTPIIPFKRLMILSGIIDPDFYNNSVGRPADSLVINGKGFNKNGMNASIGGTPLSNFKVDSSGNSARISLRIPKTFFGEVNDETITQTKTVTVTGADGKAVHKDCLFYMSPFMQVFGMQADHSSYSQGTLAGSGGMINILVTGRNLKSDATIYLDSPNGTHTQNGLQVSGFPDNFTIQLTPSALAVGNYQVRIERNNALYGLCNFTLAQ